MSTMALPEDATMNPERRTVRRIVLVSVALGAACAAVLFYRSGAAAAASSLLGTALGIGNLLAIASLIERLLSQRANKGRAGALLLLKTLALFALAGFVVSRPWASGSGFIVGFTAVVFGIIAGGLWGAEPPRGAGSDQKD